MAESVTLEIPDSIAQQARQLASQTQQRFEDVLLEWLTHSFTDLPIETLPDSQVLALCELQLDEPRQQNLSTLLARQSEGQITSTETQELNFLMKLYRSGMVRKAKALQVAVERGIHPPLSATA